MLGIDEVLDYGSGFKNPLLELVEVEVVGLAEELELPLLLGGDDRRRAAAEAAVVDSGNRRVMVGELRLNFGIRNGSGGEFGLLGQVGIGVTVEMGGRIGLKMIFFTVGSHGRGNLGLKEWWVRLKLKEKREKGEEGEREMEKERGNAIRGGELGKRQDE